jgi:hypothetical protein
MAVIVTQFESCVYRWHICGFTLLWAGWHNDGTARLAAASNLP